MMNLDLENKFEYPILTKVHGILDYASLKIIKDELKSNATSIHSNLGGGANGHLGLIMDPIEYVLLLQIPYTRPLHPTPLIIVPGTTQHESNRLRDDHKEALRLFREMTALEKCLLKLLSQAIPAPYLKPFRNHNSNAIDANIPTILTTLFQTYGIVPEEQLLQEEASLRAKVFEITEPLIILYNEVEDL